MSRYGRRKWGARRRRHHPGRLDVDQVVGVALHWPAIDDPIRGVPAVMAALRGWQNFHMDGHGWSDIAYNEAIDQDGNVYVLRGLRNRSAANGDTTTNGTHSALLLVLAAGETPSVAMVAAVRRRIARHRELFPGSTRIVGHQDIRPEPTSCPGPIVEGMLRRGRFNP